MLEKLGMAVMVFFLLLFVVFLAWALASIPVMMGAESLCLEAGYPRATVTWNWKTYCVREENEYEIVKPLRDVLEIP